MTDKAEERAREILDQYMTGNIDYRAAIPMAIAWGQANPSPAAVARVLREAADRAESFCKSKCEGCAACQISEAIEVMIPERERHETR